MNYRRKKPRRNPRCALCTPNRMGNGKGGTKEKVDRQAFKQTGT